MNNLVNISNNLDQIMVDITVRQMLNPDNKDFYIGTLTLDKVASMFVKMSSVDITIANVFWTAFSRAQARHLAKLEEEAQAYNESALLDDIACEYAKHGNNSYYGDICPKCLCTQSQGYRVGCACPNCEYVEE